MKEIKIFLFVLFTFATCFGLVNSAIVPQASSTLPGGKSLKEGEYLDSGNGYYAVMQSDGNLVLYRTRNWIPSNAYWHTNTSGFGKPKYRLVMQTEGNLFIEDSRKLKYFTTRTYKVGKKPYKLILQTDANLVLYDGDNKPIWASNTGTGFG